MRKEKEKVTKLLDYLIRNSEAFAYMTDYEKWEYRERVLAGIKEKATYVGLFIAGAIGIIAIVFLGAMLGN